MRRGANTSNRSEYSQFGDVSMHLNSFFFFLLLLLVLTSCNVIKASCYKTFWLLLSCCFMSTVNSCGHSGMISKC